MAQVVMTVDRNDEQAQTIEQHIREQMAMGTVRVQSGEEALRQLVSRKAPQPDVILIGLSPEPVPLESIRAFRSYRNDVQIIVMGGHNDVERAMQAMVYGASDFLLTPCHPEQLTLAIRNALVRRDLQIEARHAWANERVSLEDFEAKSAALQATLFMARKLAATDDPLLLEGAPGTGKELFARAVHGSSSRKDARFVAVNVSAYLREEVMGRLFGDERQAGLLAKVGKGSLLLRNIDALPDEAFHHLLHLARDARPIHPARPEARFHGRMMFAVHHAAHRSFAQERPEINRFFSQLNVLPVSIPYLHDIPEDIPFLARLLCRRYAALEGKAVLGISAPVEKMLKEISWPGNIEQLSQGIFNAVMCCEGSELQVSDFRYLFRPQGASVSAFPQAAREMAEMPAAGNMAGMLPCMDDKGNIKRLQDIEQEMIRYALERYSGHMSDAAKHLGIGRSTLYRKLSSMGAKKRS